MLFGFPFYALNLCNSMRTLWFQVALLISSAVLQARQQQAELAQQEWLQMQQAAQQAQLAAASASSAQQAGSSQDEDEEDDMWIPAGFHRSTQIDWQIYIYLQTCSVSHTTLFSVTLAERDLCSVFFYINF